jgi:hypothetical protein
MSDSAAGSAWTDDLLCRRCAYSRHVTLRGLVQLHSGLRAPPLRMPTPLVLSPCGGTRGGRGD